MGYAWTQRMLPQGECRWTLGPTYNGHAGTSDTQLIGESTTWPTANRTQRPC